MNLTSEKIRKLVDKHSQFSFSSNDPKQKSIQEAFEEILRETSAMCEDLEVKQQKVEILRLNLHPKTHLGLLQSRNKKMQQIFLLAEKYKDSFQPILILGEKGNGKEALARTIHMRSRRQGPFLVYDFKPDLQEFLFHEDATLYFGEVSLTEPEKQNKILEALLLSSKRTRIIISARRLGDLEPALSHRLKSTILTIPLLRERKEDILPMIDFFVREFSKNEKNIRHFSPSALIKLVEYDWPGNMGELKLEIKRILMDYPDKKYYSIEVLSDKIVGSSLKELFLIIQNHQSLPEAMEVLERKMVLESLIKHSWNKSKVSRELGISRSGLIQKVQKYNISSAYFSKFSATKRRITSRNSGFISVN